MKKFYILSIFITILLMLSGCFAGQATTLVAPEVVLSEDRSHITWQAIPYAVHYEVIVDGNKTIVRDATEYYFTDGGEDIIVTIRAIGDGIVYKSSEIVTIIGDFTVALTSPELTLYRVIEDLHIEWIEIDNADGYIIDINGTEEPILASSVLSFIYPLPNVGIYTIGVKAIAPTIGFYVDSARVERVFTYTLPTPAALDTGESATKNYDKVNTTDLEFLININDDTTYILTGEGITSSDYTFAGDILKINSAYLRTLAVGARSFTFTTEQSNISLTININDTRSPQLLSNGSNFNLGSSSNLNIEISILLNSATLTSVYLDSILQVQDTDYTYNNSKVIYDADDIYNWAIGSYEVKLVLNTDTTEFNLYYTITVIDTSDPYSEQTSVIFDKNDPLDVNINLVLGSLYSFDTVQGLITPDNWSYSSGVLTFDKNYLSTLDVGEYFYVIYTKNYLHHPVNAFAISIEIINTSNYCYNIRIDLDSAYPNILLRWDYDGDDYDYYYRINGITVNPTSPITAIKQVLVTGVSKTSSFTYQVKSASGAWSTVNTWNPDSAGTSYMSSSYTFMGETYDYYINSQEEFNNFIYYSCFDRTGATYGGTLPGGGANTYGYKVMPEVFIAFDYGETIGGAGEELSVALNSVPLKGSFSVGSSMFNDGRVTFTIIYGSDEQPSLNLNNENNAIQQDFYPSHIDELLDGVTRSIGYNDFAINSITKTQSVYSSEQLFNVAQAGIKPIPNSGSTAETIYNEAKDILRDIINDEMSEYDKVHAIYDWLIFNVQYDRAVLVIYNDIHHPNYSNLNKYKCFYLEGVFIPIGGKRVAVCDGFAKAFVLLARIEGIEAVKVSGVSNGVNHAWNKVLIDGDWYTIDSTWGNVTNLTGTEEHMTHAYLLVSDIDLLKTHRETEPTFASPVSYDYFKRSTYAVGYDYYIVSQAEFNHIINTLVVSTGTIYIEIYNATGLTYNQLMSGLGGIPSGYSLVAYTPASVILLKFTK